MSQSSRTPEVILADMEVVMKSKNHADWKAASNLQLSAELQTILSASADAASRRNLRIANVSLAIAIMALAISATQLLFSLRPSTPPVPPDQAAVDLYQRQLKAAEDQLAHNEKQMRSADDILQRQGAVMQRSEQQATQMEALTKQWEQQATRYDTILTRWGQQPGPPPPPPKEQ